jgi:hypothetical protein
MHCIATMFVPQLLTNDQKQWCINVCLELRKMANKDPAFISRNIMGDESWIYGCDPVDQKRAWQVLTSTKSMLIVFLT